MLKKMSRFFIVAVIELTVLGLALFLFAPYLLASMTGIPDMEATLNNTRLLSFFLRVMVYIVLFLIWPYFFKRLIQHPSIELMRQINQARYIFVGALFSIEILYWVGQ